MFRTTTAAVVTMVLIATAAHATIIEIPLPGPLGAYPLDESHATRIVTVVLPQVPTAIHGVFFRIAGTTEVGAITCEWGGPYGWPIDVEASMDAGNAHYWFASDHTNMPEVSGPFGWTAAFRPIPTSGTTWDFLMDGVANVSLYGAPAGLVGLCFENPSSPTAIVTEAVLVIDAEFPIAVQPSTWGRIKALYRDR
jgi:hypothetical protein